jgi:hypothetical protein
VFSQLLQRSSPAKRKPASSVDSYTGGPLDFQSFSGNLKQKTIKQKKGRAN